MKKVFTLVALASMFTLVACGPSAEEIAAKDKAHADSIAAVEAAAAAEEAAKMQATADSIAAVEAAAAQATADSIAKVEESKKGKKK